MNNDLSADEFLYCTSNDIFKQYPLFSEIINVRRSLLFVTVTAKIIGPTGVYADKNDIANFSNTRPRKKP